MHSLLVYLRKSPRKHPPHLSNLSSYPGLLFDEPHHFEQLYSSKIQEVINKAEQSHIDFLILIGDPLICQEWKNTLEVMFPKLFIYLTQEPQPFQILQELRPQLKALRHKRLTPLHPKKPAPPKDKATLSELYLDLPLEKRKQSLTLARSLVQDYELEGAMDYVTNDAFEKILQCLVLLKSALPFTQSAHINALDCGTHIWSYAPALRVFFESLTPQLQLHGIELDGDYLYAENLTRKRLAMYHAKLSQATHEEISLFNVTKEQDIITFFLPIVIPETAILWQIPAEEYQPVNMFQHAFNLLKPGGYLFVFNGVEVEYQATLEVLKEAKLPVLNTSAWHCPLRQKQHGYYTLVHKSR